MSTETPDSEEFEESGEVDNDAALIGVIMGSIGAGLVYLAAGPLAEIGMGTDPWRAAGVIGTTAVGLFIVYGAGYFHCEEAED